jgi:hypothetical protein
MSKDSRFALTTQNDGWKICAFQNLPLKEICNYYSFVKTPNETNFQWRMMPLTFATQAYDIC